MGAWEDRGVRGVVSLLALLAALLAAAPASAQSTDNWRVGGLDNVGVGAFLGYAFGAERGLEWGIETFGTRYFKDPPSCSADERSGLGPLLRLSILSAFSRWQVTGALHGGSELARPLAALDAELGGTLAFQRGGVRGDVHTGLTFESSYLQAYGRQEWLMPSYSFGGGIRVNPTFGYPALCQE